MEVFTHYYLSIDAVQITTQEDKVLIAILCSEYHPALRAY